MSLMWDLLSVIHIAIMKSKEAVESMSIKDAVELANRVWELIDIIYTPIYGVKRGNVIWHNPETIGIGLLRARMKFNGSFYHRAAKFDRDFEEKYGYTVIEDMKRSDAELPDDGLPDFEDHHYSWIKDCLLARTMIALQRKSLSIPSQCTYQ